jgi:hypothetical protein
MKVYELIAELEACPDPFADVTFDCIFTRSEGSRMRAVVSTGTDVVLRDFFCIQNGDVVLRVGGDEYEVVGRV